MSGVVDDNDLLSTVSKENDDLFLDLVRQRPCLYDKTLKDYYDKIVVENAMEEIAFIMQMSVDSCEKKWKDFKQAYTREKTFQELESRSGSGASTRKKWIFFDRMKDLFSINGSRHSYTNIAPTKEVIDNIHPVQKSNRKRKNITPVQSSINKIDSTIASLSSLVQSASKPKVEAENIDDDVDILTGKIIAARLNKLSPGTAKKKRKLIMKCLIDSDSDEN